jgi:2-dehydro-3-deoxyphosphogalactonate aldolase
VAGGGVTPDNMAGWKQAGATGFGIGGKLYTPGVALDELRRRAEAFAAMAHLAHFGHLV